jgi:molybdopterin synthase catalytic subunit
MSTPIAISVQTEDFDLGQELSALTQGNSAIGGVAAFVGLVRDVNEGKGVSTLSLEHYPGMTEKSLQKIADQACARWALQGVRILHRVGDLAPTDQIVLVLTASMHRHAAFESAEFIMDFLKSRAPFWKKEHTPDGAHWVDARESDEQALARWGQDDE